MNTHDNHADFISQLCYKDKKQKTGVINEYTFSVDRTTNIT